MRLISILFCVLFLIQCTVDNEVHFVQNTFDEALDTADKTGKKIMLDFWADG